MKVAVTGSSGLIGTALVQSLRDDGHQVLRLVRRPASAVDEVEWDPAAGRLDPERLAGVDAAVNLAGVNIGTKRWNEEFKQLLRDSRVDSTRTLSEALAAVPVPPRVLVSASAMGYYGSDHGDRVLDESDPAGAGFFAGLCVEWEAATAAASEAGVRVCHTRSGLVMSRRGGAFARMLPLARLGLAGPLGSGRQYWTYVSLADEVRAIRFLLAKESCAGAYDVCAPTPVTNREFTATLGRVLRRPAVLPAPGFALRIYLGELAQDVLGSLRVVPTRLLAAGFRHLHPDAEAVIRAAVQ